MRICFKILIGISPLLIVAAGCSEHDLGSKKTQDIFVAGFIQAGIGSDDNVATYWKNGTPVSLATKAAITTSIFISPKGDVYATGSHGMYAAYWKNNEEVHLSDSGYGKSIFVSSKENVYITGVKETSPYRSAVLWKNGTMISLTDGSHAATGYSVFISENEDVFVAGTVEVTNGGSSSVATYWKNGNSFSLTDGSTYAIANSVFVANEDVFIAGYERSFTDNYSVATYWKNGVAHTLKDTSNYSFANSVFVTQTGTVYVAGLTGGSKALAVYWKDGIATLLPATDIVTDVSSICVTPSGDVYVSGTVGHHAVYWKNGLLVKLNDDSGLNGSSASSLFLVNPDGGRGAL